MIPRFVPPIGPAELVAALTPSAQDDVARFEAAFANIMGQKHAVAFPYGRTGLLALLNCLGLADREVICPAYTCVVVPNAVVKSGNRPAFADSGADGNARLDHVGDLIGEKTGAVIATSIFGNPVDLDTLGEITQRHPELPVIQDCAHSFLCEWAGQPVNKRGISAIYGLNVSKTMTSIFGGMVTTDNESLAQALIRWRAERLTPAGWGKMISRLCYALAVAPAFWPPLFAVTDRLRRAGLLDRFTRYYDESEIDMPADYLAALTPVEARVGRVQTGKLKDMIAARRAYNSYYREALTDLPALAWVDCPPGSSISHVATRVANRDSVRAEAARRGVELGEVIEYSVPELAAYRRLIGQETDYPVAGVLSRTTINLPTSLRFEQGKADKVIGVLRAVLQSEPPAPPLPIA